LLPLTLLLAQAGRDLAAAAERLEGERGCDH
jgi:hypothetical protein